MHVEICLIRKSPGDHHSVVSHQESEMNRNYGFDIMDGQRVPQLVLDRDHVLADHAGTVHVEAGNFMLEGTLRGTLDIQAGVSAQISGRQQGTVSVASRATVIVTGVIEGSTTVERDATIIVERGAKLAGTLANEGTVIVRGTFGGARSGRGELRLEGEGYIKQPRSEGGVSYYDWSSPSGGKPGDE
jgi:cytoskeletal protein CcmA (bactofilin family)